MEQSLRSKQASKFHGAILLEKLTVTQPYKVELLRSKLHNMKLTISWHNHHKSSQDPTWATSTRLFHLRLYDTFQFYPSIHARPPTQAK